MASADSGQPACRTGRAGMTSCSRITETSFDTSALLSAGSAQDDQSNQHSHCAGSSAHAQEYRLFVQVDYYMHNGCAYRRGNTQDHLNIVQVVICRTGYGKEANSCREFLSRQFQILKDRALPAFSGTCLQYCGRRSSFLQGWQSCNTAGCR